ncbi:MAG: hypothetical protein EHM23_08650 [Acidobacteria bacterium]|nr:MAG: hypothetical protein EHM23_08650 [Acidobacteriota bacterium]
MSTKKAKCPVCGVLKFQLIPGSECYCPCGVRFRVGLAGDEASIELLDVALGSPRFAARVVFEMREAEKDPTRETRRFT